jgi:hypothetical protein
MANYARLVGCPSVAAASSAERSAHMEAVWDEDFVPEKTAGWGPALTSRYCIPLFWLGGFSAADLVTLDSAPALCTEAALYRARLQARKPRLIALLPAPLQRAYSAFYEQWIDFVRLSFQDALLLDASDIFHMTSIEEGGAQFRAAVSAIDSADRDAPIDVAHLTAIGALPEIGPLTPDTDSFFAACSWRAQMAGAANSGDLVWPPEPVESEIEFARGQARLAAPAWPKDLT